MGGKYEATTAGSSKLRIHLDEAEGMVYVNMVHVHDDAKGIRFVYPADDWAGAYAKFRNETVKTGFGLLVDENLVELKGTLTGSKVTLEIRSPIKGLEEFDSFMASLDAGADDDEADDEADEE